jgi:hypothetical protein
VKRHIAATEMKEPTMNGGGANNKDVIDKDTKDIVDEMLMMTTSVLDDVVNEV